MLIWRTDAADLLVDGGIASCGGQPHLLVEMVTDGVRDVDAGVCVSAEDRPAQGRKSHLTPQGKKQVWGLNPRVWNGI